MESSKAAVERAMSSATTQAQDLTETTKANVAHAADTARETTQQAAGKTKGLLERNPLGLAIGSIALGFLAGLMVPISDFERERFGPIGDRLTAQAKDAANDMVTQGKTVVATAVASALKSPNS
ncbi:MAG: hypothetical protein NVS2B8_18810 [Vulcanimicrobiaceae bacterium]